LHGLTDCLYHCIGRHKNELLVFETEYPLVNIDRLCKIKQTDKSLAFNDGVDEYRFNFSKSVLMKKFSLENAHIISKIDVKIFDDPYEILLKLLHSIENSFATEELTKEYVILPLYSTRNKDTKEVQERSGLNQWNANGRERNAGEVYISIPAKVRQISPSFFPTRDIPFSLKTPKGKVLSAKVCQDNSKALMTNPNNALSEWLLRDIFSLKERELLTYDKLKLTGYDAVKITKINTQNYEITLAGLDSFEDFVNETT